MAGFLLEIVMLVEETYNQELLIPGYERLKIRWENKLLV